MYRVLDWTAELTKLSLLLKGNFKLRQVMLTEESVSFIVFRFLGNLNFSLRLINPSSIGPKFINFINEVLNVFYIFNCIILSISLKYFNSIVEIYIQDGVNLKKN
jgi:hypothetical protein